LSIGLLALLFGGCGSNNTGRIVGTWKITSTSKPVEELDQVRSMGLASAWNFKADGTVELTVVPELTDPDTVKLAESTAEGMKKKNLTGKYTLGIGNLVTFSDSPRLFGSGLLRAEVVVTGDVMELRDSAGFTMRFARVR